MNKVLIIEDDVELVHLMQMYLSEARWAVETAATGPAGTARVLE